MTARTAETYNDLPYLRSRLYSLQANYKYETFCKLHLIYTVLRQNISMCSRQEIKQNLQIVSLISRIVE